MHPSPAFRHRTDWRPDTDWRQRLPALLLSLAAVALIVLALLRLGLLPAPDPRPDSRLTTFDVAPEPQSVGVPETPGGGERAAAGAPPRAALPAPAPPPRPVPPPPATPPLAFPDILILRGDQFAGSDIGRLPSTGDRVGDGDDGADTDTASAYGPGEGPGGERLFDARWRREPTRAELAGYLPPTGAPAGSWALIACRTAERFEVQDCRSLGESPAGSGLARAMRQAAWQFRVHPPRVGGRALVGAWVRIRISFNAGD